MHNPTYADVEYFVKYCSDTLADNITKNEIKAAQYRVDNGEDFNDVIDSLYDIAEKRN